VELVHLVGFITKKFVTMHGHMNVKFYTIVRTGCGLRICSLSNFPYINVMSTIFFLINLFQTFMLLGRGISPHRQRGKSLCSLSKWQIDRGFFIGYSGSCQRRRKNLRCPILYNL